MPFRRFLTAVTVASVMALYLGALAPSAEASEGQMLLRGRATKEDALLAPGPGGGAGGPSLSRKDIGRMGDPFRNNIDRGEPTGSPADQVLSVPQEAFEEALPKRPFGLSAETESFLGERMDGVPDQQPSALMQPETPSLDADPTVAMQPGVPIAGMPMGGGGNLMLGHPQNMGYPPGAEAADPDESQQMRLLWDAWHKRVANAVFARWNYFANLAFRNAPCLTVKVVYVVTRDGRIENVHFSQKSHNVMFNGLGLQAVKSLNGDRALLQFPPGSRRQTVMKQAEFYTANCGVPTNSIRYTVGDKETVSIR